MRASECLPTFNKELREAMRKLELSEPSKTEIMRALDNYKMFSAAELAEFEKEM